MLKKVTIKIKEGKKIFKEQNQNKNTNLIVCIKRHGTNLRLFVFVLQEITPRFTYLAFSHKLMLLDMFPEDQVKQC